METSVTGNVDEMAALMEKLATKFEPLAARRAVNRTRDQVRSAIRNRLATETGIPKNAVSNKRVFGKGTATPRNPTASIFIGTWVVPVHKIGNPRSLKKGGVSYKTVGGTTKNPRAFIPPTLGGAVFERVPGSKRLPIRKISADIGPAAEAAVASEASDGKVASIFEKEFRSTMDYRINEELKRWRRAT